MQLSIVIVNYNVRHFLSACLQSVEKAIENIDAEVFVVDNHSPDDSVDMVRHDFPWVNLIANTENRGFSSANNQAIRQSKGKYILLLNPDTIVAETCFSSCLQYMDANPKAGGLGVKMIDGSGNFLPESKRGLPTPMVAFYKIFGLSRIFPKSKVFGKYHLGFLDNDEVHEVDVLSGAFMFLRKSLIDEIGGLDESFFMYGEDIDLSYRITKAGFKNIYYPRTSIIHFKGESTKKSSVNYVLVFYRAMIIFARKHFNYRNANLFSFFINGAVYFRATIALLRRLFEKVFMVLMDAGILYLFLDLTKIWYEAIILHHPGYYAPEVEKIAFPVMIATWIFSQLIFGAYRQPTSMKTVFKGLILAALLIVSMYAMLSEGMRFSRAIIFISVIGSFLILPLLRLVMSKLKLFQLVRFSEMTSAWVGKPESLNNLEHLLDQSAVRNKIPMYIDPFERDKSADRLQQNIPYIASLYQLHSIIQVYRPDELIFCLKDVSASDLISSLELIRSKDLNIYLFPKSGNFLLRSHSAIMSPEYIVPIENPTMDKKNLRNKRFTEIAMASILLVLSPVLIFLFRNPLQYLRNLLDVLRNKAWLSGTESEEFRDKKIILSVALQMKDHKEMHKKNIEFQLRYGLELELEILFSHFGLLDRVYKEQNRD